VTILRPEGAKVLESVGVTEDEEAVYRVLLERPGATPPEVSHTLGQPPRKIRTMLAKLESVGLVSRIAGPRDRFAPAPPEVAIEVLVLNRQEQLERTRLAAKEMDAAFRAARAETSGPLDIVEVVLGREAVDQRFEQLVKGARERLLVFDKPPYAAQFASAPNELELQLLARGVSNRALYDTEGLAIPGRIEQLSTAVAAGEEARAIPDLPMKMFIADDHLGLIPLSLDEPGLEGALLVQPSPVLQALIKLFETLWDRAVPIDRVTGPPPPAGASTTRPSDEDEQLLMLLVAGLKDRAVARQLGVAPRTVLRRVANLMSSLGAQTRFQAGWLSAKRGTGDYLGG
jgi:sugar-specific transcriptional regulator TrmB